MTPATIIEQVRRLIQDEVSPFRYSDTMLLGFVNQVLKRMAMVRPDLFIDSGNIPTTQDSAYQTLPSNGAVLVEIFGVAGGAAIEEVDRDLLNRTDPNWINATSGTPKKYVRNTRNRRSFFLYPRPQFGVQLVAEYSVVPSDYTINQTILQPSQEFFPAIVDGTVFLAEAIDNEHVDTGRAKLFLDSFTSALGISGQARVLTDREDGGSNA
jgi:hypothetical protein